MKNDRYKKARGGWSRLLEIRCAKCQEFVCSYQKDGPGPLKRMYIDRFTKPPLNEDGLKCDKCGELLGVKYVYKKENRPAYRLFVGSIEKSIVKSSDLV